MTEACFGLVSAAAALPSRFDRVPVDDTLSLVTGPSVSRDLYAETVRLLAAEVGALLPFGPGAGSVEQIRNMIGTDPGVWRTALARVTGCVEIVVTLCSAHGAERHDMRVDPKDWLRHRAETVRLDRERRTCALQEVLDRAERAGIAVLEHRILPFEGGLDIALLVPSTVVPDALRLPPVSHAKQTSVTGPWPCFSFGPPLNQLRRKEPA